MAMAVSALASSSTSTSNTNSYAGGTGTPVSGDLLIAFVVASDTVAVATMSGTFTWNFLTSFTFNGGVDTVYVFWAYASSATSTTPTFDCTGDNATGCCISVMRITGVEGQTQPYCRQIKATTGSSTNPAATFDIAPLTGNGVIACCANKFNSSTQFTAPTNWTELHETSFNTPTTGFTTDYRASGETGTTITWTNSNNVAWGAILMELYVAGTGPEMVAPVTVGSGLFGVQGAP